LLLAGTLAFAVSARVHEAIPNGCIVRAAGRYAIEASGASGGASANGGGLGDEAQGGLVLAPGESLAVYVVGQGGEPSTRAMMLLGFVGLGLLGYRRANTKR
jgi:hypothetical protein